MDKKNGKVFSNQELREAKSAFTSLETDLSSVEIKRQDGPIKEIKNELDRLKQIYPDPA
jgi:DUF4097 and DUF4098 domain-containing protein YvlB